MDMNQEIAIRMGWKTCRSWQCLRCLGDLRFVENMRCAICWHRKRQAKISAKAVRTLRRRRVREGLEAVAVMRQERSDRAQRAAAMAKEKKARI